MHVFEESFTSKSFPNCRKSLRSLTFSGYFCAKSPLKTSLTVNMILRCFRSLNHNDKVLMMWRLPRQVRITSITTLFKTTYLVANFRTKKWPESSSLKYCVWIVWLFRYLFDWKVGRFFLILFSESLSVSSLEDSLIFFSFFFFFLPGSELSRDFLNVSIW